MAKRIVTKIGDILCVELDNERKRYIQYIANDFYQLNSSVIRVFKREYPIDYVFDPEEVVSDEVDFYSHTILRTGIADNVWYKVGKSKDVGDLTKIMFRCTEDCGFGPEFKKSYRWYIWTLGDESTQKIGELTKEYKDKTHEGLVIPYCYIVYRMKYGEYNFRKID